MAILTKQEMNNINLAMLGQGAPVDIDGVGYNKYDFAKMESLADKDLTDYEAYKIATTLLKYSKTQLVNLADKITATITYYQKTVNEVNVVGFNKDSVKLSWSFNKKVSNCIKDMNKSSFRWTKPNGTWVLDINWDSLDTLIKAFHDNGFSTENLQNVWDNLGELPEESVALKVTRPKDSIDTLFIEFPYNKGVVESFKKIPNTFFKSNGDIKGWECYVEDSLKLYEELEKLNKNIDLLR